MKKWFWIIAAALLTVPWFTILIFQPRITPPLEALFSGLSVMGAAFLLSWGAEIAQFEIPRSLAVAFVAIVAVLPEYAVDIYIAGKAGRHPSYIPYAVANMTGANRLIIGIAWAVVVFIAWLRTRKRSVTIDKRHGFEFSLLFIVTLYSFVIPFKKTLSLEDGIVLIGFFIFYLWSASKGEIEEPEIEGPVETIAALPRRTRRWVTVFFFLFSFIAIGTAARPFAEGLIATGRYFHIEEFLLIQILAPLASEAPEFIVSAMLAFRGNASLGMGTLLSSKINQWTLLVGMVPIVYIISSVTGGHPFAPLPLDGRQIEEILLTSAQSFCAVAIIADFDLSLWDGGLLFVLYLLQFFFRSTEARYAFAVLYFIFGISIFVLKKKNRRAVFGHFLELRRSHKR